MVSIGPGPGLGDVVRHQVSKHIGRRRKPKLVEMRLLFTLALGMAICIASLWRLSQGRANTSVRDALFDDPSSADRWCDLADEFSREGDKQRANYCFQRAGKLDPNNPAVNLRAAEFYSKAGEKTRALEALARAVGSTPGEEDRVFVFCDRLGGCDETFFDFLRGNRRASQGFFDHLIDLHRKDLLASAWKSLQEQGYADDSRAGSYVRDLVRAGNPDAAAEIWAEYLGGRRCDYKRGNELFNGDFESEPTLSVFDWSFAGGGPVVKRDSSVAMSGHWSLRIDYDGTRNINEAQAWQQVVLGPGRYRLQAYLRTENLTTDEGVRLRLYDKASPSSLDIRIQSLQGTQDWTLLQQTFLVPPQSRLLCLEIRRDASERFENRVAGSAWVDGVSIARIVQ